MSQSNPRGQSTSTLARTHKWLAQSLTQENQISAYFEPLIQMVAPGWSTDGTRSKVIQVRSETADVYTLVIRPGKSWKGFKAGQHLQISAEQNGTRQTRFFSVSSSPAYFKRTGLIDSCLIYFFVMRRLNTTLQFIGEVLTNCYSMSIDDGGQFVRFGIIQLQGRILIKR